MCCTNLYTSHNSVQVSTTKMHSSFTTNIQFQNPYHARVTLSHRHLSAPPLPLSQPLFSLISTPKRSLPPLAKLYARSTSSSRELALRRDGTEQWARMMMGGGEGEGGGEKNGRRARWVVVVKRSWSRQSIRRICWCSQVAASVKQALLVDNGDWT